MRDQLPTIGTLTFVTDFASFNSVLLIVRDSNRTDGKYYHSVGKVTKSGESVVMSDWTNGKWLNGISGNNVTFLNNSDYTVYMTCVAYNE